MKRGPKEKTGENGTTKDEHDVDSVWSFVLARMASQLVRQLFTSHFAQ